MQITVKEDLSIDVAFVGLTTAPPCPPARLAAILQSSHSIPLAWALLDRVVAAQPGASTSQPAAGPAAQAGIAGARETVKRKREDD